jgi:general secretion pathway protein B
MSYILDALRKADAERERDPARGIHAHAGPLPVERGGSMHILLAVSVVTAIVVVSALTLWMGPQSEPRVSAADSMPKPQAVAVQVRIEPPPPPAAVKEVAVAAAVPVPRPAASMTKAAVQPQAARPAAAASEAILTVSQLPAEIQQGLPKLPIAGGVYSQNAAQRMLLVSGQLVTEGTEIAPGLVLEQIRPRSAVLRFRGWRYSVDF